MNNTVLESYQNTTGSPEGDLHDDPQHGIHIASWNYEYVKEPFILTSLALLIGMFKIGKAPSEQSKSYRRWII